MIVYFFVKEIISSFYSIKNSFRNIISEGILKNEIKNINSDIMVFSILSTLRSLYLWVPKKDDMEPTLLAANLSEVLLKGINK